MTRYRGQGPGRQAVVDHVREQLIGVLALRGCRFEYGMLIGHPPRLEQDGRIMTGHGHVDVDLAGMPDEEPGLGPRCDDLGYDRA